MDEIPERRRFRRVNFDVAATLSQGGERREVTVADLSLNGVLLRRFDTSGLDLQSLLQLAITLADNVVIYMDVIHVHESNQYLGFRCTSIDLDSIGHLRRVVEFNLGDAAASERELAELFGSDQTDVRTSRE